MFDDALNNKLLEFYGSGPERGGLVLADYTVLEIDNVASDPGQGYQPSPTVLFQHIDNAVATWHTHPDASSNLSVEDWETYILWPNLRHMIVGNDGVRHYVVKGQAVVNA